MEKRILIFSCIVFFSLVYMISFVFAANSVIYAKDQTYSFMKNVKTAEYCSKSKGAGLFYVARLPNNNDYSGVSYFDLSSINANSALSAEICYATFRANIVNPNGFDVWVLKENDLKCPNVPVSESKFENDLITKKILNDSEKYTYNCFDVTDYVSSLFASENKNLYVSLAKRNISSSYSEKYGFYGTNSRYKPYLNITYSPECTPQCSEKDCGDDSCGGNCGVCDSGQNCVNQKCIIISEDLSNSQSNNLIKPDTDSVIKTPNNLIKNQSNLINSAHSLIAYYPFDVNANDASGSGLNGVVNGATLTTGKKGQAYYFDGIDDYIDLPSNFDNNDLTISTWIYHEDQPSVGAIFGNRVIGGCSLLGPDQNGFDIFVNEWSSNNKKLYAEYKSDLGGCDGTFTDPGYIPNNQWKHIVLRINFSKGEMNLFIDGVKITSESYNIRYNSVQSKSRLGSFYVNSLTAMYKGRIDELKIWDYPLSDSEILNEYNNYSKENKLIAYYPFDGNANDASGNGLNGVGSGGVVFNGAGVKGLSAKFDGADDYITLPSTADTILRNSLTTVGMWVYINKVGPNSYSELYSVTGNTLSGRTGIKFSMIPGQKAVGMDASGDFYSVSVPANLNLNTWYYITAIIDRNSNKFKVYVNGNYIGEDTFTVYTPTTSSVRIGGNFLTGNNQDWLNGTIDELKIWNYALNDSDILNEYNSAGNCTPEPLSATCGTWICGNKTNNCWQNVSCGTCSGSKVCSAGYCISSENKLIAYYPFDGNANDIIGSNNGVVNGAVLTTGKVGQAYKFDGINDYISANSIPAYANGTISAWVKCSSNTCTGSFVDAMEPGTNGGDLWLLGFHGYYGTDFRTGIYTPGLWNWAGSQVTPVKDSWYYLTAVWGLNGVKIYVNGQLKGTNNYNGGMPAHNKIVFGGSTWRNFVNATIDEVKIWNYALSDSEILNEYNISSSYFVIRNGSEFYLNGKPFYFAGANTYYLFYANNNANCVDSSHQGCLIPLLNSAKALNLTVIRTWGSSENSQRFGYDFQPSAGVYDEATFAHFDRVIKEASDRNLKLMVVLVNNWDSFGGMCQYVKWCGLPNASLCAAGESYPFTNAYVHDSFYTNSCTKQLYKNYVAYVLNRTNTLTGIKYKDDPTIFAWELANEPRARSDANCVIINNWIGEMSAYIKSIDSKHMVTGGVDGGYKDKTPDLINNWWYSCKEGQDYFANNNWTTIDFTTFNYYDDRNRFDVNQTRWLNDHIIEAHSILGKPVVLQEFNTLNTSSRAQILANWYSKFQNLSLNGDFIWMLSDFRGADADGFEFICPNDSAICNAVLNHANFMNSFSGGQIRCSQKSDCGTDGYYGINFCQTGNVYQNYTNFTCNNPGTLNSYCSNSTSPQLKQTCGSGQTCINGNCSASNILYVCKNGCGYNKIQDAVDAAISSQTILITDGGVYNENIVMGGFSGRSNIILDCNGAQLIGNGTGSGIYMSKGVNCTFKNCIIKNYSAGFYNWDGLNIFYINNTLINNTYGLYFDNSDGQKIIGNHITNNTYGLYFYYSSVSHTVDGNIIESNTYGIDYTCHHAVSGLSNFTGNILKNNFYGIFDCNSYDIIKNNTAINNTNGFYISGSKNDIIDNTAIGNEVGIDLGGAKNNTYLRNNLTNNSIGISLYYYGYNNTLVGNNLAGNNNSFYIGASFNNTIYHNNFADRYTAIIAYTDTNNSWNLDGEGNYWSNYDSSSEGCNDFNSNGICDSAYEIYLNNRDYFPFTSQNGWVNRSNGSGCIVPYSGMNINKSTTFCPGNYYLPSGINITGNNSILDCANSTLTGNSTSFMIYADSLSNITIRNCNATNSTGIKLNNCFNSLIEKNNCEGYIQVLGGSGIGVDKNNCGGVSSGSYATNITISNNNLSGLDHIISFNRVYNSYVINNTLGNFPYWARGISLDGVSNILFDGNTISDGGYAFVCWYNCYNNTLRNNNLIRDYYSGFDQTSWSSSSFYHNNLINITNSMTSLPPNANYFNITGEGNYWSNYDSSSEGCNDLNSNGICDSAYSINNTIIDYFPFTSQNGWVNRSQKGDSVTWLKNQQDLYTGGLVDSYDLDGSDYAYTYDQAVAAIAFTEANETARAKKIFDRMKLLQNSSTGGWLDCYKSSNYAVCNSAQNRYSTGPIAWMVIAINYYEAKTKDSQYASMAKNSISWMDGMRNTNSSDGRYGSLRFCEGDASSCTIPNAVSTEHNHDAYSAYLGRAKISGNSSYSDKANLVRDYLVREMWAPSSTSKGSYHDVNVFWRGYNDFAWCTDTQTWGVLSLGTTGPSGENFAGSLDWLFYNPYGSTRNQQTINSINIDGFKSCTEESNYIWLEGTEGAAAAYYLVNQTRGDYFHNQMKSVPQSLNKGEIYSFSDSSPGTMFYPNNWRYGSVASNGWSYFNDKKINPFYINGSIPATPVTLDTQFYNEIFNTSMNYFLSNSSVNKYGLPLTAYKVGDRARFGYSNPTEWGYLLQAYISAAEKGIISRNEAVKRINVSLNTMAALQSNSSQNYKKLFYPYYKVTQTFSPGNDVYPYHDSNINIPSIDNGLLYMSLLITEGWARDIGNTEITNKAKGIKDNMNFSIFVFNSGSNKYVSHTINANTNVLSSSKWDVYSDEGGLMAFIEYASNSINLSDYKALINSQMRNSATWNSNNVKEAAWFNSMFTWGTRSIAGYKVIDTNYSKNSFVPTTKAHLDYGQYLGYSYPGFSDAMTLGVVGFYIPPNLASQVPASGQSHITPHALFVPLNVLNDLPQSTINNLTYYAKKLKGDSAVYYFSSGSYPYGFVVTTSPYENQTGYSGATSDGKLIFETLSEGYIGLSLFNALQNYENKKDFYDYAINVPGYQTEVNETLNFLYPSS